MRLNSLENVKMTFRNENDNGVLADMDNLPTAVLYVDGVIDSTVGITVTRIGVGTYRGEWTMGEYNTNDIWEFVVTGNYNGVNYTRIVKEGYIGDATFAETSRYTRLEAYINETPTISWYVGEWDLDDMTLRMTVGSPTVISESPTGGSPVAIPVVDAIYTFTDANITRNTSLATITISATITGAIGVYPWELYDITTGEQKLQSGVIDVVQKNQ
jgi:hypothetical protein